MDTHIEQILQNQNPESDETTTSSEELAKKPNVMTLLSDIEEFVPTIKATYPPTNQMYHYFKNNHQEKASLSIHPEGSNEKYIHQNLSQTLN